MGEVVTEVGSGLNGERRELHCVLADLNAAVIVVVVEDCLARARLLPAGDGRGTTR